MIQRLVIAGVGLIGGSLALALKAKQYCNEIIGLGRDEVSLRHAYELGVIDRFSTDPKEALEGAEVVLLAVPMQAMLPVLNSIHPYLPEQAILTDAGSTKQSVIQEVEQVFGANFARFVPGHPIAGREKSGVDAALADLYEGRRVILTPTPTTDSQALQTIETMWQVAGGRVEHMTPELHDQVLAATSHLPHVLAFALVDTLLKLPDHEDILRYAGGGFRDSTRIASSDPTMWRDICLTNTDAIVEVVEALRENLAEFVTMMRQQDAEGLHQRMATVKQARDAYISKYDAR
ncbi:MAG: prephenate dehydrogenase/arogenate dehydrogenase family protein [Thiofilum sp.]|uniref:prephenate dehydrogenase n=1 Tax=Thiofilum sp. TaxID=2212733 RepID=UPI0025CBF25C|nr:prephenate dehydrogenase/arogenate dehydrogenase family protein [Thiofilum sp.]MBK8454189.1 prephenate dehydrogenase/arogenate dehydrogenase family protein [Thiofilum sp.]